MNSTCPAGYIIDNHVDLTTILLLEILYSSGAGPLKSRCLSTGVIITQTYIGYVLGVWQDTKTHSSHSSRPSYSISAKWVGREKEAMPSRPMASPLEHPNRRRILTGGHERMPQERST